MPEITLTYRMATGADVPLLAALNHQLIEDEGHNNRMTVPDLAARMQGWLRTDYTAIIFEDVVSDMSALAYVLYRDEPDYIYIRHFFVARDYRRRGVGRTAILLLLKEILPTDKPKRLDVLAHNERGAAFWKSVGFEPYAVTMEIK